MVCDSIYHQISSERLRKDLEAICDFGGRVCGSEAEKQAVEFLRQELSSIPGGNLFSMKMDYDCWRGDSSIELADRTVIPTNALLFSPLTPKDGLLAEVRDIGYGTEEDFRTAGSELSGRIVLVRHSYMFSPTHVHRMLKYAWARECGAIGFIVANPWDDSGQVAGGLGVGVFEGEPIPGVGVDAKAAIALSKAADNNEPIRLYVKGQNFNQTAETLFLDLPGSSDNFVAVSAHVDGHALAESAIDNASGLAVALEMARLFAPLEERKLGIRLCFFNLEEWGLLASKEYIAALSEEEKRKILININLDAVAGDTDITAMISEYPGLRKLVRAAADIAGITVRTYDPRTPNSDHYHFASAGIPAMRLIAGFDKPKSNLRHVLTERDKRDLVSDDELIKGCKLTAALFCMTQEVGTETLRQRV
ncbi:MAG: hypothetical protein A2169_08980 [Deltaproteobacteria bacterium RBG_13_47_9]|jgi:hypothetical protein|nr:MAG: hypothetical protein A2169_08980 [Deltaproteobacteria bacterium RBG_13_47_9]